MQSGRAATPLLHYSLTPPPQLTITSALRTSGFLAPLMSLTVRVTMNGTGEPVAGLVPEAFLKTWRTVGPVASSWVPSEASKSHEYFSVESPAEALALNCTVSFTE